MTRWKQVLGASLRQKLQRAVPGAYEPPPHTSKTRLRERFNFGPNPGNLRMFDYRPPTCGAHAPLLVVLHGCTQTAARYEQGAGWSTLADQHGFVLLLPQQQPVNNPNGCFNWFLADDTKRDEGEALSIRQMVETSVLEHGIDRRRIFVTGLSAGGAMTSVLLACYPDVFAAGAIIAGLPYGAATSAQEAFRSMRQSPSRPAREWGDLVRKAYLHPGPWPRISVWHGNADQIVAPTNAREILKQWTDVHGIPMARVIKTDVNGFPREVWTDPAGDEIIEAYSLPGMAHGTPVEVCGGKGACGFPGPFFLPVGISSSYHIANFFGIAGPRPASAMADLPVPDGATEARNRGEEALFSTRTAAAPAQIGEVINKALRAAGLIRPPA